MQSRIDPDIDIVSQVLIAVLKVKPDDAFCQSLQQQYAERGGLSRKQLEGLMGKASRIQGISPGRLATLEAIIKKKHVTHRSEVTIKPVVDETDAETGERIGTILEKYPQHKAVRLLKIKYEKERRLPQADKDALVKFFRLLIEKK